MMSDRDEWRETESGKIALAAWPDDDDDDDDFYSIIIIYLYNNTVSNN